MEKNKKFERVEKTIKNHFVPQVYLKYFTNKKGEITCYNKQENNIIKVSTNGIGFKNHLYTARDGIGVKSYETYYTSNVDNTYDNIMKKIIQYHSLPIIIRPLNDKKLRGELSNFIVNQILRVPSTIYMRLENYNQYLEKMKVDIKELEKENGEFDKFIKVVEEFKNEFRYKNGMLDIITKDKTIKLLSNVLVEKSWILLDNETCIPFFTSDNPVIIYNYMKQRKMIGGINRKDVFIGFPLSAKFYIIIIPNNFGDEYIKEISGKSLILKNDSLKLIQFLNTLQIQCCNQWVYYSLFS